MTNLLWSPSTPCARGCGEEYPDDNITILDGIPTCRFCIEDVSLTFNCLNPDCPDDEFQSIGIPLKHLACSSYRIEHGLVTIDRWLREKQERHFKTLVRKLETEPMQTPNILMFLQLQQRI